MIKPTNPYDAQLVHQTLLIIKRHGYTWLMQHYPEQLMGNLTGNLHGNLIVQSDINHVYAPMAIAILSTINRNAYRAIGLFSKKAHHEKLLILRMAPRNDKEVVIILTIRINTYQSKIELEIIDTEYNNTHQEELLPTSVATNPKILSQGILNLLHAINYPYCKLC